jgi:hypothetical protein
VVGGGDCEGVVDVGSQASVIDIDSD